MAFFVAHEHNRESFTNDLVKDCRESFTNDLIKFSMINEDTVANIVETRVTLHNQRIYRVRWKDSWLLEDQLKENCMEIIKKFWDILSTNCCDASQGLPGFRKAFSRSNRSEILNEYNPCMGNFVVPTAAEPIFSIKEQVISPANEIVPVITSHNEELEKLQQPPADAITFFTDTAEFDKNCGKCNKNFKTKCETCQDCIACRKLNKKHYIHCEGDKVCAICSHCFFGETCTLCCRYCGNVYPTLAHLKRHVRVTHLALDRAKIKRKSVFKNVNNGTDNTTKTVIDLKCETCHKQFYNKHKLKRHKKIHSTSKEFHCEFCQKDFSQKIHLTKHLLQHGVGEKRFKCHKCNKWFNHKISLRTHAPKCNSGVV